MVQPESSRSGHDARVNHHDSHAHLLHRPLVRDGLFAEVDAIIVPSARPVERMRDAVSTAAVLGCPLLALCSKESNARAAAALGEELGADVVAVDVVDDRPLPAFETTRLLASTRFERDTDTSRKRNLGLLIAWMSEWRRIVFLDDDITGTRPDELRQAAYLLGAYRAVGLSNAGYPDNSVVCHAHRATGGAQDTFIGAGAVAISVPGMVHAFFPQVYNEDWLFLADALQERRVATMGLVTQEAYDPFTSPRRARIEEFGDCLAEGLYWLLDLGHGLDEAAMQKHWLAFTARRRQFVRELIGKVSRSDLEPAFQQRVVESLKAAQESHRWFGPKFYLDYVRAWRRDTIAWREHVARLPVVSTVDKALANLGLISFRADRFRPLAPAEPAGPLAEPVAKDGRRFHTLDSLVAAFPLLLFIMYRVRELREVGRGWARLVELFTRTPPTSPGRYPRWMTRAATQARSQQHDDDCEEGQHEQGVIQADLVGECADEWRCDKAGAVADHGHQAHHLARS